MNQPQDKKGESEPDRKIEPGLYTRGLRLNLTTAKDLHYQNIALPGFEKYKPPADESKYARAARLGLCFKCLYEGTDDVNRRPISRDMPYCEYCMIDMSIGTEKLERQKRLEVKLWFRD